MDWNYYPIADQCHAGPTTLFVSLPKYSLKWGINEHDQAVQHSWKRIYTCVPQEEFDPGTNEARPKASRFNDHGYSSWFNTQQQNNDTKLPICYSNKYIYIYTRVYIYIYIYICKWLMTLWYIWYKRNTGNIKYFSFLSLWKITHPHHWMTF